MRGVVLFAALVGVTMAAQQLHFPKKVKKEWDLWADAFSAVATSDRVTESDIPALFREHFVRIHNALPGHEGHTDVDDDVDLFMSEAKAFVAFVKSSGASIDFTFADFKQRMYDFMDDRANEQYRLKAAAGTTLL